MKILEVIPALRAKTRANAQRIVDLESEVKTLRDENDRLAKSRQAAVRRGYTDAELSFIALNEVNQTLRNVKQAFGEYCRQVANWKAQGASVFAYAEDTARRCIDGQAMPGELSYVPFPDSLDPSKKVG